jgi:hypothetical protein
MNLYDFSLDPRWNNAMMLRQRTISITPQVYIFQENFIIQNRDRSPCNFVYIKIDYILSKFSFPLSTLWYCCFEIYSYYYRPVLMSIVLRWSNILYKVRALNDMFLCVCTEVKIVKSMPRLTGYDQPTIAVIRRYIVRS